MTAESVIDEETDFVILLNAVSKTAALFRFRDSYEDNEWKLDTEIPFSSIPNPEMLSHIEPEDQAFVSAFFDEAMLRKQLRQKPVVMLMYRQRLSDGTCRRKRTRAFYLDETHEDIVIERRDITDLYEEEQKQQCTLQKALDEANAANRAKSEFLARMSHDLRTPMNVIIGLTSLAMDKEELSSEMRETLTNIASSSKYLLSLINDCLDLEKITSGKIELHPVPYAYADFYNSVRAVIGPLCLQKQITFILEDKGNEHPAIMADKIRMEQIFYNLLSNAVKFTPSGGKIEFLVDEGIVQNGINTFECIVRDNGIGMSEAFQKDMFKAFTQESTSITAEYHGSGLGLAIVKQLVDLMGAVITVKSRLGEGTEFRLRFRFPVAQEMGPAEKEKTQVQMERLRGRRVLLAEDHPLNAMIAVKILEKAGVCVTTADNGQAVLETYQSAPERYFDAVLMDIRMPVMNGLEAAKAIRALDRADAKTVPIVAMTANAFDTDVEESLQAGMNAHLSKPIEAEKLYETLAGLI